MKTKVFKIYWKDYKKIRSVFRAKRNERLVDYFTRLAEWLKGIHVEMLE
jgi:hypothetical protein